MAEKRPKTKRSESEMDTGGSPSTEFQSRCKKGHMTDILTDSDEAFANFVKDHDELYVKPNGHL